MRREGWRDASKLSHKLIYSSFTLVFFLLRTTGSSSQDQRWIQACSEKPAFGPRCKCKFSFRISSLSTFDKEFSKLSFHFSSFSPRLSLIIYSCFTHSQAQSNRSALEEQIATAKRNKVSSLFILFLSLSTSNRTYPDFLLSLFPLSNSYRELLVNPTVSRFCLLERHRRFHLFFSFMSLRCCQRSFLFLRTP